MQNKHQKTLTRIEAFAVKPPVRSWVGIIRSRLKGYSPPPGAGGGGRTANLPVYGGSPSDLAKARVLRLRLCDCSPTRESKPSKAREEQEGWWKRP